MAKSMTLEEDDAAVETAAIKPVDAKAQAAIEESRKLVLMRHPIHGESRVHPTTVIAHKNVGWSTV